MFCYGVGCNTSLLPSGTTNSDDDPRWFTNTAHNPITDGNVSSVMQKGGAGVITSLGFTNANPSVGSLRYAKSLGYPYISSMEINSSNWLLYNKYNPLANTNDFKVEFYSNQGGYVGSGDSVSDINITHSNELNEHKSWW